MKIHAPALLLTSLLSVTSAAPVQDSELMVPRNLIPGICLLPLINQAQANLLVQRYSAVIAQQSSDLGSATQTAEAIVDSTYSEQSDSANIQLGIPLGALTTASKQIFVVQSQKNPPVIAQTIGVYPAGCNSVIWQWRSTQFGDKVYPVQGFHLFQLDNLGLIHKTYFEFNSIAGALDIGFTVINQAGQKLTPSNV